MSNFDLVMKKLDEIHNDIKSLQNPNTNTDATEDVAVSAAELQNLKTDMISQIKNYWSSTNAPIAATILSRSFSTRVKRLGFSMFSLADDPEITLHITSKGKKYFYPTEHHDQAILCSELSGLSAEKTSELQRLEKKLLAQQFPDK